MTAVKQGVTVHAPPNELQLQVRSALCEMYKTALFCRNEHDLTRSCLELIERLTSSQLGWFGELNGNDRVDVLAVSDPLPSDSHIPGSNEAKLVHYLEIPGLWAGVFKRGESLIINQPDNHSDRLGLPEGHPPITSLLVVPLKLVQDTVGIICLVNKQNGYQNTDLQLVEAIVAPFYETLLRTRSQMALEDKFERYRKDSESKYRMIFNNTGTANVVFGLDGTFLLVNQMASAALGGKPQDIEGKTFRDFFPDDRADELLKTLLTVAESGEAKSEDILFKLPSGNRWYSSVLLPVKDDTGKAIYVQQVGQDITARKTAEEELIRTVKALQTSNQELEQFAYIASHDLQEPLRMVSSYLQLLKSRYADKLDKDANEFISFAVDGSNRMSAMIADLLAYSRVGTKGKEFSMSDSGQAVDSAVANLKVAIHESGAKVSKSNLPTVFADQKQLIQLFQHLISNAIKYRRDETPQIEIAGVQKDDAWVFSVKDNGIGIDSRYFERIFMIFQRLHPKGKYGGTGIGLALCKKIVERHHGHIWLESEPGKGSTFYFTISSRNNEDTTPAPFLGAPNKEAS